MGSLTIGKQWGYVIKTTLKIIKKNFECQKKICATVGYWQDEESKKLYTFKDIPWPNNKLKLG